MIIDYGNFSIMNKAILFLIISLVTSASLAQDINSDKLDFALLLKENKNEELQFKMTTIVFESNKNTLLPYISAVTFPIVEQKEPWTFGYLETTLQPKVNLNGFYKSIPKFTNFSPYAQKQMDFMKGRQVKILKGYDFCGRPLY